MDHSSLWSVIPQPGLAEQHALIASLAPPRLQRFRAVFGGRDRDAVALYLLDAELASHLHAALRFVEVALREAMHRALARRYGRRWFDTHAHLLDEPTRRQIGEATRVVGPRAPEGKVVAQLMLGTWVRLLDRGGTLASGGRADYERDLWRPALSTAFTTPGGGGPTRQQAHALAQRVNWARNRINHCEPVVFGFPQPGQSGHAGTQVRRSPVLLLRDLHGLLGHLDTDLADWLRSWGDLNTLVAHPHIQLSLAHAATWKRVTVQA